MVRSIISIQSDAQILLTSFSASIGLEELKVLVDRDRLNNVIHVDA